MANTTTLLCLFFTLLLTTSLSKDLCHKDDKRTLLKINKALNNPYNIISWDPKTDCCSWISIECGDASLNHRVTSLDISDDQISAQIPPEVGDLPYLQTLIFRKLSNLTGQIPPTIAKLKYLRFLRLSWTNLTGPVPGFLGQLKNLEYIDLSYNDLSGSIPSSLSSLPKLGYLELSRNKLTGPIPESFGSFKGQVPDLFLSHNQLTGSVPKSLGNLDFYRIDLSRNKLKGDASMLFGAKKTTWQIDYRETCSNSISPRLRLPRQLIYYTCITMGSQGVSRFSGPNLVSSPSTLAITDCVDAFPRVEIFRGLTLIPIFTTSVCVVHLFLVASERFK